jgi:hypothetical protein
MTKKFDYFVLFAEMRTGSNHVEESINAFPDLHSYGEVFNPVFLGHHNLTELFGHTLQMREIDPLPLIPAMVANTEGLPGFRFFHDHDPRVVDKILSDPRCAKVILMRNPLDSYVSLKIASATGQWRLVNEKKRKTAQATFDGAEFDGILDRTQAFQHRIQRVLQTTGQSAFYLRYEDIADLDVINGMAAWLGAAHPLAELPNRLKKQNPSSLREKLTNYDAMEAHLAARDPFGLDQTPQFALRPSPGVPGFMGASRISLLFMPVAGAPEAEVRRWLSDLDGAPPQTGFSQKTLRPWMRKAGAFTALSVVRHPFARAYHVFNTLILPPDVPGFGDVRRVLMKQYGLPIPAEGFSAPDYGVTEHKAAFGVFLDFVNVNLNGGTSLRTDPAWATQLSILQSACQVVVPTLVVREPDLPDTLREICTRHGVACPFFTAQQDAPFALGLIHDRDLEDRVMEAYRRDYLTFGFKRWDRC